MCHVTNKRLQTAHIQIMNNDRVFFFFSFLFFFFDGPDLMLFTHTLSYEKQSTCSCSTLNQTNSLCFFIWSLQRGQNGHAFLYWKSACVKGSTSAPSVFIYYFSHRSSSALQDKNLCRRVKQDTEEKRIIREPYLVKSGRNHRPFSSPKTSMKLPYLPRLKPSLSGPVRNIGDRNDSGMLTMKDVIGIPSLM